MPSHPFEHTSDAAQTAAEVLSALRSRGETPAADALTGRELAGRVDRLVEALAGHAVRRGEVVRVHGEGPGDLVTGCLAVWLAHAVPHVGPEAGDGPARLALDVRAAGATDRGGEPAGADAALLVSEDLVGCVAHPVATLGRLRLPEKTARLLVAADWRVDAWLPLVLEAWTAGVEQISLLPGDACPEPAADAVLACPAWRLGAAPRLAADGAFAGRVTWGAGTAPGPGDGTRLHGFGDTFVLASTRAGDPAGDPRAHRGEVYGRHRVTNAAGRALPANAWGRLALAGRLPTAGDSARSVLDALREESAERTWVTEYRARGRSDGTVEFDPRALDPLRVAGRRLSPEATARTIAPAVPPGAVLVARDPDTDRARLVLCGTGEGLEEAAERLTGVLPSWAGPLSTCRVPALPRDAEGRVDLARLAADAPPDTLLLDRAARALDGGAGRTRLRAVPVAADGGELPLPDGFVTGGGHYPATRPAEARGPLLTPPSDDLADRLRKAAATDRGIPLVDGEGRAYRMTYAELLTEASRVAAYLRGQGLGHGDEVVVHAAAAGDIFTGVWACVLIGVLPVPLTPATPYEGAGNPLWHLLGPDTMLTGRTVLTTKAQRDTTAEALRRRGLDADLLLLETARAGEPLPAEEAAPRSPALMLLTSGSTGAPKGVALSHRNLVSLAESVRAEFALDGEVSLNWLGVDHVGGLVQHHIRDLCLAHEQVHVDTGWALGDPTRILDLLDHYRVTVSWMANFGFNLINEQAGKIAEGSWDLSPLKVWENGGEAVTHEGNQRFLALLAPHGLRPDVIKPVFGMTETSSAVIAAHNLVAGRQDYVHWLSDTRLDSPVRRSLPGEGSPFAEVGTPMAGLALRVVDAEGQVCPEGVSGRIEVSGLQVMKGYYRNPEADADAFTADGWLRMGDCGFMVDGSLVVTGREKDVLIINGLNYAARALENSVEAVHGVRQGCCAAVPVRRPDAVTDDLVVFYSSTEPGAADATAIESALISEHSMRPVAAVEIGPEEWPRTAIGKIRRPLLAAGFQAGDFADRITLRRRSGLGDRTTVPAWCFVPEWNQVAAPAAGPARRVLWLDGEPPAGAALAARSGAPFEGFDEEGRARFRTGHAEDLEALLEAASARLGGLDAVVEARWHARPEDDGARTAAAALTEAPAAWGPLLRAAAQLPAPPAVVLATRAAAAVTGDEESVAHAALTGVAESLAQSRPRLPVLLVDGATDDDLLTECALRGTGQVAHRDGTRLVRGLRPLDGASIPPVPRRVLRAGGSYAVVGGLGGVGAHLTQHLLRQFGARVLVLGRDAAEPGTARGGIRAHLADQAGLEGAAFRYTPLDATDVPALRAALDRAEADWGPLDGLFNLAGEGSVAEQLELLAGPGGETAPQVPERAVTRLRISHALDEALTGRTTPLVVFSSVNGFFGGAGFTEYAGACAYQAAHAAWSARRTGAVRLCLDWSMWKQVGMAAGTPSAVTELAGRRGFATIGPAQGLASLHTALDAAEDRVLIGLSPAGEAVAGLLPFTASAFELEADGTHDPATIAALTGVDVSRIRRTSTGAGDRAAVGAAHTEALLDVFRDVLGDGQVGEEDNFFAAGGDSIRAIQVVARAAERGFRFSPLDLFEHKTAAALLAHLAAGDLLADVGPDEDEDPDEPAASAAVPPVFGWWLETADRPEIRDHLTMSMRYTVAADVGPDAAHAALLALAGRHDALRTRLTVAEDGPRLVPGATAGDSVRFTAHEVPAGQDATKAAEETERALHREVSAESGPIARAALLRPGDGAPAVLVLVIHHAAVDGVSWRIIEEDLRRLLEAEVRGVPAELPPPTLGFLPWARRMERRAARLDGAVADAWAERLTGGWGELPRASAGRPREGGAEVLERRLPADALDGLGGTSVYEVLLTAVVWSLARWAGTEALAVDVEGHGRLDAHAPLDLSRTVGWFTAIAPVRVDLAGCAEPGRAVSRVRRELAALRGRDQEWGLLRYGGGCPAGHPLTELPERQISFNYLGVFDGSHDRPDPLLAAVPGSLGAEQSPEGERRYLIDVAAVVTGGVLELAVKYSPSTHRREDVTRWLDDCEAVLSTLLADGGDSHPGTADVDRAELLLALEEISLGPED
ncbi:SDR family NAD(P)-dependent oxidoreductase [Streptomyces halstedii]|uniref:SDR family NAD(P)-dependent oxidoreductase n=2 Tax=Streptomyces TaxID=1883 RepID=UPI00346102CA